MSDKEQTSYPWGGPDGQYIDKDHQIPATATTSTSDYSSQKTSIESAWETTRFITETSYVTIPTKDSLTSPPPTKTTTVALWSPDGGSSGKPGEFVVSITVVITVAHGAADSTGSTFLTSTTSSATNSRLGSGSGSDKGEVEYLQPWDQWSQGHRAGVVIAALVGFLVVVGLGFILWTSCMVVKRRRALYGGDNESWEMMSVSNAKREDAMMHGALLSEEGEDTTVKKVLSRRSSQVGSVRESADHVEDEIVNDR